MTRPPCTPLTTMSATEPAPLATAVWLRTALQSAEWVDATPFRAHLHYLVGASGLSGRVVAEHCGVPTRLADRLLVVGEGLGTPASVRQGAGTPIRRARRISHFYAARLLAVRPVDLLDLRWRQVSSAGTLRRLDRVVAGGLDLRAFASTVQASATELEQLRTHRWSTCVQLVAVQVAAACQVVLPDQRSGQETAIGEQLMLRAG